MFDSLMAEAELYPEPTAEEIAEADRILAEAFTSTRRRAHDCESRNFVRQSCVSMSLRTL